MSSHSGPAVDGQSPPVDMAYGPLPPVQFVVPGQQSPPSKATQGARGDALMRTGSPARGGGTPLKVGRGGRLGIPHAHPVQWARKGAWTPGNEQSLVLRQMMMVVGEVQRWLQSRVEPFFRTLLPLIGCCLAKCTSCRLGDSGTPTPTLQSSRLCSPRPPSKMPPAGSRGLG